MVYGLYDTTRGFLLNASVGLPIVSASPGRRPAAADSAATAAAAAASDACGEMKPKREFTTASFRWPSAPMIDSLEASSCMMSDAPRPPPVVRTSRARSADGMSSGLAPASELRVPVPVIDGRRPPGVAAPPPPPPPPGVPSAAAVGRTGPPRDARASIIAESMASSAAPAGARLTAYPASRSSTPHDDARPSAALMGGSAAAGG